MNRKFSVLKFLSQVFMIYGITAALLNIFCMLFGNSAYGISSIFSLGSAGVGVAVSFQFLIAVFIMNVLRYVFMTDILIKKMSAAARVILLFTGAFAVIIVFIIIFEWFPYNDPTSWIMFVLCFIVSCSVSTFLSVLSERQENRRLEEALKRCKEEQEL